MAPPRIDRCMVWASLVCALVAAAPRRASCQDKQLEPHRAEAPPAAKEHFERGREHFRAGRYREAIVELRAALELDPDSPTLMYNIAYANELLGELEEAIAYYRKYIDALPAAASGEREKIRATLRRLEGHRAQVEATPKAEPESAEAPSEPAAPVESKTEAQAGFGRADAWFWAALAGGVAMFGGATASGLLALDREDRVAEFVVGADGSISERQELQDEADRLALTSDLLIGGGATLVTAAALLYFLRAPDAETARYEQRARAGLGASSRELSLFVRVGF